MSGVAPGAALHVAFVMEQHLGHRTFHENLQRHLDPDPSIVVSWVPVTYAATDALWERLPGLGNRALAALRGRTEVRRGLHGRDPSATFFNTQVPAVLAGRGGRGSCYVLCTDITPRQYDRMAERYDHRPDGVGLVAVSKHMANQRVFRSAARVVGWSTWARDSVIQDYGVPAHRTAVIPPGVDTTRWRPSPRPPVGPMRILFVGGDLDRKGGRTLMEAFRRLPEGSAELVLVTRTRVPEAPGITVRYGLQPNSPELVDLFRASDVFVLASEAEAFGIAAVEAAASGLPVVATRVGGIPDIVVHEETGFLITPRDVGQLAQRLAQLASDRDLARRLGAAARRRAVERFDAATNAGRVVRMLREVATAG